MLTVPAFWSFFSKNADSASFLHVFADKQARARPGLGRSVAFWSTKIRKILTELSPYKSRWEIVLQKVAYGRLLPFERKGSSKNLFKKYVSHTNTNNLKKHGICVN